MIINRKIPGPPAAQRGRKLKFDSAHVTPGQLEVLLAKFHDRTGHWRRQRSRLVHYIMLGLNIYKWNLSLVKHSVIYNLSYLRLGII